MNATAIYHSRPARNPWRILALPALGCLCASLPFNLHASPPRPVGAVYDPPADAWTYIYDGDKDTYSTDPGFASLDGTWSYTNDSCAWDGSKIGGTFNDANAPGGIMSITEQGVTFLRVQDTGHPGDANRKLYLGHNITDDGGSDTLLDDGVTLSFRARIPTPTNTTGPIDPLYPDNPDGAASPVPYPAGGDGQLISGGKGDFGIKQRAGGIISFGLCVPGDKIDNAAGSPAADFAGLNMNKLNGNTMNAAVDFDSPPPAEPRAILFDPTKWHEFWITIKKDDTGVGTHQVSIYMDGSTTGTNLLVTSSNGDDYQGAAYLAMGGSRTSENFAVDVDFFAYKIGAVVPTGGTTPQQPHIDSVVRSGNKIVITWTGAGALESTTNILSGWTEAGAGGSPATITMVDPARYYRVKK